MKRKDDFTEVINFRDLNRKKLSELAGYYYESQGFQIINENVPLIIRDGWLPEEPVEFDEIELFLTDGHFDCSKEKLLSRQVKDFGVNNYCECLKEACPEMLLEPNPTYRLLELEDDIPVKKMLFGPDRYDNFINTCELLSFVFSQTLYEQDKLSREVMNTLNFPLRDQIDPFDFYNRSCSVGIITLLIFSDIANGTFYLHHRAGANSKGKEQELLLPVEAGNTIHVVPSGTFQPSHEEDVHHHQDFQIYRNIMREFGEELFGKKEYGAMHGKSYDVLSETPIKQFDNMICNGEGKAYYLGIGLDCLNLKPEILTVLVFDTRKINRFMQELEFENCFEGEYFEVEFTKEELLRFVNEDRIQPSCAACLWQAHNYYEFLKNSIYR